MTPAPNDGGEPDYGRHRSPEEILREITTIRLPNVVA